MGFFNEYNRFTKTGLGGQPGRLNYRYQGIIEWNKEIIRDKKILDIGSHDGRWAFAALKAGAKHVTCIEPRPEHVKNLHENMEAYGMDNYSVIEGDAHEEMPKFDEKQFDLILCLGFFYHSFQHNLLMTNFKRLNPEYVIFDTDVSNKLKGASIELRRENTDRGLHSIGDQPRNLIGVPTVKAMEMMCEFYGFDHEIYEYKKESNKTPVYVGENRSRITLRATNMTA